MPVIHLASANKGHGVVVRRQHIDSALLAKGPALDGTRATL